MGCTTSKQPQFIAAPAAARGFDDAAPPYYYTTDEPAAYEHDSSLARVSVSVLLVVMPLMRQWRPVRGLPVRSQQSQRAAVGSTLQNATRMLVSFLSNTFGNVCAVSVQNRQLKLLACSRGHLVEAVNG